jgi:peptidoglycan-associated lipoprotein
VGKSNTLRLTWKWFISSPQGGINVKNRNLKWFALVIAMGAVLMLGACKKKTAPPPPPPPPAAPSPTAAISVSPNTIEKGQSASLTWQASNATDVSIDGIGAVQATGSQSVSPSDSTTYHLVAKGAGGTQEATARLTVTQPPPPVAATPSPTDEDLFGQTVKDIYFDYDKSDIRGDQQASMQGDAQFLNQHTNINFTIEGHCDERGSTEYNLALGDQRASSVKNALVSAGVSASRIKTISYGKEKPFCLESNEACWQQNRRGHFVYQK